VQEENQEEPVNHGSLGKRPLNGVAVW